MDLTAIGEKSDIFGVFVPPLIDREHSEWNKERALGVLTLPHSKRDGIFSPPTVKVWVGGLVLLAGPQKMW